MSKSKGKAVLLSDSEIEQLKKLKGVLDGVIKSLEEKDVALSKISKTLTGRLDTRGMKEKMYNLRGLGRSLRSLADDFVSVETSLASSSKNIERAIKSMIDSMRQMQQVSSSTSGRSGSTIDFDAQIKGATEYEKVLARIKNLNAQIGVYSATPTQANDNLNAPSSMNPDPKSITTATDELAVARLTLQTQKKIAQAKAQISQTEKGNLTLQNEELLIELEMNKALKADEQARIRVVALERKITEYKEREKKLDAERKSLAIPNQNDPKAQARVAQIAEEITQIERKRRALEGLRTTMASSLGTSNMYYNTTFQTIQVLRELPNFTQSAQIGLMSLSNNLPTLIDGFAAARKEAGSLGKVILNMVKNPMFWLNVAAVGLTTVLTILPKLIKLLRNEMFDMGEVLESVADGLRKGNSELSKNIEKYNKLTHELRMAKNGLADGKKSLEEYNKSFGRTLGIANSTAEAYEKMRTNMNRFYSDAIRHEVAMAVLEAGRKQLAEDIAKEIEDQTKFGRLWTGRSNTGDVIESVSSMQTGLMERARTGKTDWNLVLVSWRGGKPRYRTTMASSQGLSIGEVFGKAGLSFEKDFKKKLEERFGGQISVYALGKDIFLSAKNGKKIIEKNMADIYSYAAELLRPMMQSGIDNSLKEVLDKFVNKFKGVADYGYQIDVDMSKYEEQGKGSGRGTHDRQPSLDVSDNGDFTKAEYYNKRRDELEKLNRSLKFFISRSVAENERKDLDARIKYITEFYKNKEEIEMYDTTKSLFKTKEDLRIQKARQAQEEQNLRQRIDKYKEKYLGKDDYDQDFVKKEIEKAEKVYAKMLKTNADALEIAERNAELQTTEAIYKYADAIAKHREDMLKEYIDSIKPYLKAESDEIKRHYEEIDRMIEKNQRSRERRQSMLGGSSEGISLFGGIPSRWRMGSQAENVHSSVRVDRMSALRKEIEEITKEYDKLANVDDFTSQMKAFNLINERVEKQKELNKLEKEYHKESIRSAGSIAMAFGEAFAKGVAGYSRDSNISSVIANQSKLIETRQKNKNAKNALKSINAMFGTEENAFVKYRNESGEIDKGKAVADFTAEWTKAGFTDDEIKKNVEMLNSAMDNINTEGGQRAFKDLKESVTKSLDDVVATTDEKSKELEEQIKTDFLKGIEEQLVEAFHNLVDMVDEMMKAELEYQRRYLNEWKEDQTKFVDEQLQSGVLSQKEATAEKEAIDEQYRKKQHEIAVREAKMERANAISKIWIATAQAIAYAAMAAWRDGGISAPILFGIYTAMLTANAAIQTATVTARPLPEYAEGTDFHQGGLAYVGDGGRSEMLLTPQGRVYKTPNTRTLVNLERGTKVFPNFDKAMMLLADKGNSEVKVISENRQQLELLKQTNVSLRVIARNTKSRTHNYNNLWN